MKFKLLIIVSVLVLGVGGLWLYARNQSAPALTSPLQGGFAVEIIVSGDVASDRVQTIADAVHGTLLHGLFASADDTGETFAIALPWVKDLTTDAAAIEKARRTLASFPDVIAVSEVRSLAGTDLPIFFSWPTSTASTTGGIE